MSRPHSACPARAWLAGESEIGVEVILGCSLLLDCLPTALPDPTELRRWSLASCWTASGASVRPDCFLLGFRRRLIVLKVLRSARKKFPPFPPACLSSSSPGMLAGSSGDCSALRLLLSNPLKEMYVECLLGRGRAGDRRVRAAR